MVVPPARLGAEAMTGVGALPRDNGELVFDEPWQGQAFGLAICLVDRLGLPWMAFQKQLIDAIADDPHRPYYESWAVALEALMVDQGLVGVGQLD